ncbi:MAG: hypothetical protein WCV92_02920 [Candidatus Buchananbacteria bacterium]
MASIRIIPTLKRAIPNAGISVAGVNSVGWNDKYNIPPMNKQKPTTIIIRRALCI